MDISIIFSLNDQKHCLCLYPIQTKNFPGILLQGKYDTKEAAKATAIQYQQYLDLWKEYIRTGECV